MLCLHHFGVMMLLFNPIRNGLISVSRPIAAFAQLSEIVLGDALVQHVALQGSTKRRTAQEASPPKGGRKGAIATPHLDSLRAALAAAEEYELSAEGGSSEGGDAPENAPDEQLAGDMAIGGEDGAPDWGDADMGEGAFPGTDLPPGKPLLSLTRNEDGLL